MSMTDLGQGPFPTLSRAPITEALIDIRVQLPSEVNLDTLRNFHTFVASRFPKAEERRSVEAQIRLDDSGAHMNSTPPQPDGFVLTSEVEPTRVQVRLDGFTMSRLQPYTRWTIFSADARDLWERYKDIARPTKVTRLAVRYINRLELKPGRDLRDYILTVPDIAPEVPQMLPDYFMRLVIPRDTGSIAVVSQGTVPRGPKATTFPIVFDIDVFRPVDLSSDASEIWSIMEELRMYKNLIFFKSLTPTFLEEFR
jgi:uncharacterized protein (TIGR04255 family)